MPCALSKSVRHHRSSWHIGGRIGGVLIAALMSMGLTQGALAQTAPDATKDAAQDATKSATKDDDPGMLAFNGTCGTCHTLREGDNRLGPTLHGIIGRKSGSVEGYNYSSSMKSANVVWDEKTLDSFIENPEAVVPGNNMKPYAGTPDAGARAKIIGFLKSCEKCGPECPAPKKCEPGEKTK